MKRLDKEIKKMNIEMVLDMIYKKLDKKPDLPYRGDKIGIRVFLGYAYNEICKDEGFTPNEWYVRRGIPKIKGDE